MTLSGNQVTTNVAAETGDAHLAFEISITGNVTDGFVLKDVVANAYLKPRNGSSNGLQSGSTVETNWSISMNAEGLCTIIATSSSFNRKNLYLNANVTAGVPSPLFACYNGVQTASNYKLYYLYKEVTSTPPACTEVPTLGTISEDDVTADEETILVEVPDGIVTIGANCTIESYGFKYSTTQGQAQSGTTVEVGASLATGESFDKLIESLSPSTTYYIVAYATNGAGTGYSNEISIETEAPPTSSIKVQALMPKNLGSVYVGDPMHTNVAFDGWYNFEIDWNDNWTATDAGYGQDADGSTGWTWAGASKYGSGSGTSYVHSDFTELQFGAAGDYYFAGRAKGFTDDPWTYDATDEMTSTTTFSLANCAVLTVEDLVAPTRTIAAGTDIYTQLSVTATEWLDRKMLIVRYPHGATPVAPETGKTNYVAGDVIGEGTVIFFNFGDGNTDADSKTITDGGLEQGTTYDYYFYSENYGYYSAGEKEEGSTSTYTCTLAAPGNLATANVTSSSFDLTWDAVTGAQEYEVAVWTKEGETTVTPNVTVAEWTFPTQSGMTPTVYSANNVSSALQYNFETDLSANQGFDGYGDYDRTIDKWTGTDEKYWFITLNTTGFTDIKLSSAQRGSNTGPKNFKLQYNVGGAWSDIADGSIIVGANWTNGVVDELALPTECENQTNVQIRWLKLGSEAISGSPASGGTNRIDNIIVTGTETTGSVTLTPLTDSPFENVESPFEVTGLSPNTAYYYTVTAKASNYGVDCAATSDEGDVTTSPCLTFTPAKDKEWHLVSAPVASWTKADFKPAGIETAFKIISNVPNTNNNYTWVDAPDSYVAGQGFLYAVNSDEEQTLNFGCPNTGEISVAPMSTGKYTIAGNPYNVSLPLSKIAGNGAGNLSFYDARYNCTTFPSLVESESVLAFKGFLVTNGSPNGESLTFADPNEVTAPAPALNANPLIKITSTNAANQTYWCYVRGTGYDSEYFNAAANEVLQLYTTKDGANLGINAIDVIETTIVPLSVKTDYKGDATLTFAGMDTFDDAEVTFTDNLTGEIINLSKLANYVYYATNIDGSSDTRFVLTFAPAPTDVENAKTQNFNVFSVDHNINIVSAGTLSSVQVLSIDGKNIYFNNNINANTHTVSNLPAGIYLVKANGTVRKVAVK
ncbi:MAG: T9SS type A sorting domain-containing protein [Prevotellaceae bacterium]|nr:T9SS type A sorting domain-containing protein [Prevotellaceae bacterium]